MKAQVVVPADTNLSEDSIVNTWSFFATTNATAIPLIIAPLKTFYDAWQSLRSSMYQWDQARIKFYDMEAPSPRPPLTDALFGLSASAAPSTLPQEVALCMSFQADRIAGRQQSRRRGRVYLGPFGATTADTTAGRPSSGTLTTLSTAANNWLTATNAASGWFWGVHSTVEPAPNNMVKVTNGWIDNAWDTQRRRGQKPTTRSIFAGP
jgi:hypothetical protein